MDISRHLEEAQNPYAIGMGTVKMVVLPKAKDVLIFRLENLADLDSGADTASVNLNFIAKAYYLSANRGTDEVNFTVTETNINVNMPIEEMKARKLKWRSEGDNDAT